MSPISSPTSKLSEQDYQSLVEAFAKTMGGRMGNQDVDVSDDAMALSERECEGYDVERLCALLSFADKNCVADAVLLLTDNSNLARFNVPQDVIRRLAVRALALEAQEVAHLGQRSPAVQGWVLKTK